MNGSNVLSQKFEVPVEWVIDLPSARYGTQLDQSKPFLFIRVSRPKPGAYLAGFVKIQSYHSDKLAIVATVHIESKRISIHNYEYMSAITMATIDPFQSQLNFAEKIGACCKCGKTLTDPRSRHYGIGPDCETRYPEFCIRVEQEKGEFNPTDQA